MDALGPVYQVLRVADPGGPDPAPGQFAMLAASERWGGGEDERPYLPRAFSIARRRDGEWHFLLEDVGPGSERLCALREGEKLWTLGPLGIGFMPPAQACPAELDRDAHAAVYACGPAGMLEAVRAMCAERDVPAQLALEAGMACGFGACFGCVVPRRAGGYLRVCIDGPVIDAAELDRVDEHAGAPA
jgi:NAD(P)H-flavin reductase